MKQPCYYNGRLCGEEKKERAVTILAMKIYIIWMFVIYQTSYYHGIALREYLSFQICSILNALVHPL